MKNGVMLFKAVRGLYWINDCEEDDRNEKSRLVMKCREILTLYEQVMDRINKKYP